MTLKNYIFIIVFAAAISFFVYSCNKLIGYLKVAKKKDDRFDDPIMRLKRVWKIAFLQSKLLRDPVAGTIHVFIFWGFILFILAVLEVIIQGFYTPFSLSFLGTLFSAVTIIQDVFGILVICAVLFALYRRYIQKVPRLEVGKTGKRDATFILLLIMLVFITN